ncbi:MAG TPA: rhomboid family intramembrane serine protease [Bacteroidia bacterium]|nr:rhomboid family intramembrane serine protease [Bacteroidia bacterium]
MSYQEYRPSSFNLLPPVIKNLLIINGLLWLAETVFTERLGFSFNEHFGLYYPLSQYFNPVQYVSYMFLHGSFMHLLSNMFALWMFGTVLENYWGPKRFLIYFFVTGIGAAIIQTCMAWYGINQLQHAVDVYAAAPDMMDFITLVKQNGMYLNAETVNKMNDFLTQWQNVPESSQLAGRSIEYANMLVTAKMDVPTVGASGAVFGVLLAFGMLFPNTLIYLYFAIPIKAKYFVILYGLFELFSGVSNNPGDNVAHFAHLGGMLFGFFLIRYWNKRNRNQFY